MSAIAVRRPPRRATIPLEERPRHGRPGPYSKRLQLGVLGSLGKINKRSAEGRYILSLEKLLVEHVGGNPSITQRLMIERAIQIKLQLEMLERKLGSRKKWTGLDTRTYGGLSNSYRLTLRELGSRPYRNVKVEGLDDVIQTFKQPGLPDTGRRGPRQPKKTG